MTAFEAHSLHDDGAERKHSRWEVIDVESGERMGDLFRGKFASADARNWALRLERRMTALDQRVLFCGSRDWTNERRIGFALDMLRPRVVIEGEARGADLLARKQAELRGIEVLPFPAKWKEYGKAAGPIRNKQMLDEGKPDLVVAFHASLGESKGTADMVARARKAGIPVQVITG